MSRPKGRRLPVSLSPRWPRWGSLILGAVAGGSYFAVFLGFAWFAGDEYAPHRMVLVTAVCGGIGLLMLVLWVRALVRWSLMGETSVELSHEPVSPGETLAYDLLQGRDHSSIRRFEATLLCRRQKNRGLVETLVQRPLGPSEIVPGGWKAAIRGSLVLPDGPPTSEPPEGIRSSWLIEIRVTFARNIVFKEEYPFRVAPGNAESPAGS